MLVKLGILGKCFVVVVATFLQFPNKFFSSILSIIKTEDRFFQARKCVPNLFTSSKILFAITQD